MSTLVGIANSKQEEAAASAVYAMPPTPLQLQLWQREQAGASSPAWNVAVRFRLSGTLDRDRLEASLRALAARHEALRTSFGLHHGKLVQRIAGRVTLPVEWCDLRSLHPEEQAAELTRLSLAHARHTFHLQEAPLFRVCVVRLADDEHVMLWNAHHAVCDGWSIGLLSRELMSRYGASISSGEAASSSTLDVGDYAVWLQQHRETPEYAAHKSYWQKKLDGMQLPELPGAWRAPAEAASIPTIDSMLLPRTLTDKLGSVAQQNNATFFHVALSAFAALMHAHRPQAEVVIGTPISGRDQVDLESVVGSFVNYLPLRFSIHSDEAFTRLIHTVRDQVTESLDHAEFRFEDLPNQQGTFAPLFSAAFICQQDFVQPQSSAGLTLTALPSVCAGALRPLTMFMVERADGWRLSVEVDDRFVSAAAGRTVLEQFQSLLQQIVEGPMEATSALTNRSGIESPFAGLSHPNVSSLPGRHVRRIPATDSQVRFWMLNRVDPEDISSDMEMQLQFDGTLQVDALRSAALSLVQRNEILRTTFEEVDDEIFQVIHPEGTIDFSFEDCSGAATTGSMQAQRKAFSLANGPLFRMHVARLAEQHHRLTVVFSHLVADGWSSGIFLEQLRDAYQEKLPTVAGKPSVAASAVEQFSLYAARERELLASPEKDRRVAWWRNHLAGTWQPLALPRDGDVGKESTSVGPHRSALSAIKLAPEDALSIRQFARECGTTPFAVFGAAFQSFLSHCSGQTNILLLTPFANRSEETENILGPLAMPVCIAAHIAPQATFRDLVAKLTEESMDAIEHAIPFSLLAPLIELKVDGRHHVLNQITFFYQRAFVHEMEWSGLRVRPLPEVPSPAASEWQLGVIERGDDISVEFQYDTQLHSEAAMSRVVAQYARLLTQAILRPDTPLAQLQASVLDQPVSLTADKHDLVSSESPSSDLEGTGVPPTEDSSTLGMFPELQQIWRRLFKIQNVGPESNFFDLGGHSLLMARLQIAVKKQFNVQLAAADVFRNPTLAQLAAWVSQLRTSPVASLSFEDNPRIIPIQPAGSERPMFVISQSMIFRTLASELGTDQPMFALQMLDQDVADFSAQATLEDVAAYYVRLIRQVQPQGPYRIAGWCVSGWIAYAVARLLEQENEEIELLMVMDAWAPGYWRKQAKWRHAAMQAIYRAQRLRWVTSRLLHSDASERRAYIRGSLHGMAAAAAKNLSTRLHNMGLPVQVRLTEEMRPSEQLEYTASRTFLPDPLRGSILVFRSEEQPTGPLLAPDMGWGALLGRSCSVEQLPGDHREIFNLPGAKMMADRARQILGAPPSLISNPTRTHLRELPSQGEQPFPMVEA